VSVRAATPHEGALRRRALRLEYLTVSWNLIEAFVAVGFGVAAGSIALIGFGFDSTIEVFAASVVIWEFRGVGEERERLALRLIALSFFVLAAYVTFESLRDLVVHAEPRESIPGIVLAAVSLVVMPLLALAKRRTGEAMRSATLIADAAETMLCSLLSLILLIGLVLNATVGWWWADPIAAIGIALLALREGLEAWRGDGHEDVDGHTGQDGVEGKGHHGSDAW
jgi:divalent metal cation (Fe/Co/Zn/Cd) transporter